MNDQAIAQLLKQLQSSNVTKRLTALNQLAQLPISNAQIIQALEQQGMIERNANVAKAIWQTLAQPVHHQAQQAIATDAPEFKAKVATLLAEWRDARLIPYASARILRGRMGELPIEPPAAAEIGIPAKKAAPQEPQLSLLERLLSESAINTALYLGAFFILAAAMILSALVEVARLPILSFILIIAFILAVVLKKRMPLPSFIFYLVGSFLIPIVGAVLSDIWGLEKPRLEYWGAFVALALWGVWIWGTSWYRSVILAGFTLPALWVSIVYLMLSQDGDDLGMFILLQLIPVIITLGITEWWRRQYGDKIADLPRSVVILFTGVIGLALIIFGFVGDGNKLSNADIGKSIMGILFAAGILVTADWMPVQNRWLPWLAGKFNIKADTFLKFTPFVLPTATLFLLCFIPALILEQLDASSEWRRFVYWGWGVVLALTGVYGSLRQDFLHRYRWPAWGFAAWFWYAVLEGAWRQHDWPNLFYFLFSTAVLAALTYKQKRLAFWVGCLFLGTVSWLYLWQIPLMAKLPLGALVYLGGGLLLLAAAQQAVRWERPKYWKEIAQIGGLIMLTVAAMASYAESSLWGGSFINDLGVVERDFQAILSWVGIGGAAWWWLKEQIDTNLRTPIEIILLASGAQAIFFLLLLVGLKTDQFLFSLLLLAVAAAYFAIGSSDKSVADIQPRIWQYTGLVGLLLIGTFTFLLALNDHNWHPVLTALAATIIALGAWQQKQIWWGLAANLLYMGAYVSLLDNLGVDEIQFYTVGTGLLGLVMHYLFGRAKMEQYALGASIISQLILLGTTYGQMVDHGALSYFLLLFIQSLLLLGYGIVIRAKSLVAGPVIAVVAGVVWVTFDILSGLPTAMIIGGTGLLLILLAMLALYQRETLMALPERMERLFDKEGWRW